MNKKISLTLTALTVAGALGYWGFANSSNGEVPFSGGPPIYTGGAIQKVLDLEKAEVTNKEQWDRQVKRWKDLGVNLQCLWRETPNHYKQEISTDECLNFTERMDDPRVIALLRQAESKNIEVVGSFKYDVSLDEVKMIDIFHLATADQAVAYLSGELKKVQK